MPSFGHGGGSVCPQISVRHGLVSTCCVCRARLCCLSCLSLLAFLDVCLSLVCLVPGICFDGLFLVRILFLSDCVFHVFVFPFISCALSLFFIFCLFACLSFLPLLSMLCLFLLISLSLFLLLLVYALFFFSPVDG